MRKKHVALKECYFAVLLVCACDRLFLSVSCLVALLTMVSMSAVELLFCSFLEPLFLPSRNQDKKDTNTSEVVCVFCDISFLVDKSFQGLLSHLLTEHKLVVSNFTGVADPPR